MFQLEIDTDKYERLKHVQDGERQTLANLIFDVGYAKLYDGPKESGVVLEKLDKIEGFLLPTMSNSSKKGRFTENHMQDYFKGWNYTDTSKLPHHGDAIIEKHGIQVLLEFKNYTTTVPTKEVDKLKRDLKETAITFALMLSINTGICGKRDFDIEIVNNTTIIYISKLQNREDLIESAIALFEALHVKPQLTVNEHKLAEINENLRNCDRIKQSLYIMESEIRKTLDKSLQDIGATLREIKQSISNLFAIEEEKFFYEEYREHQHILEQVYFLFDKYGLQLEKQSPNTFTCDKGTLKILKTKVEFKTQDTTINIINSTLGILEYLISQVN